MFKDTYITHLGDIAYELMETRDKLDSLGLTGEPMQYIQKSIDCIFIAIGADADEGNMMQKVFE